MKPGFYTGTTYEEYDAIPAVRSTDLKRFEKTAAHAYHARTNQRDSDSMRVGRALHVRLLEPLLWKSEYAVAPKVDRRTKAGKAAWAEFQEAQKGKIVLTHEDHERVEGMARACAQSPDAQQVLLGRGKNEAVAVWEQSPGPGLAPRLCKARLDRLTYLDGKATVVDIKTTRSADAHDFTRSFIDYGYDVSAAWYLDGIGKVSPQPRDFAILAIENTAPYVPRLFRIDREFIEIGRTRAQAMFARLAEAEEKDAWGGWPRHELFPPEWYVRQYMEDPK